MISRIESVLQAQVPTYCADREEPDFPLPAPDPEHLIVSHGDATLDYEALAGPDVFTTIRYGDTSYSGRQSGDGEYEKYQATTEVGLALVSRVHAGLDLPNRNGRQLTKQEWERDRAELYRGVLMDIATKHIADGPTIFLCLLDDGVSFPPFEIADDASYILGQVSLLIVQNVRVPIPQ
jgi:hypothetical protein